METKPATPVLSGFDHYMSLVTCSDALIELEKQGTEMRMLLLSLDENKGNYAYAEGKWTLKQIIGHIADGERIFSYRALRFARNDKTPLPSFEQDDYVANSNFNERTLADLCDELIKIRQSTLAMFRSFTKETMQRTGTASGRNLSVENLLYIITGHEKHHLNVIRERYL